MWLYVWLTLGVAVLISEGVALFNKRTDDTLSEHFWRVLKVNDPRPTWIVWVARSGVLLFCAWLGLHLTLGWFTPTHPLPF